MKRYPIIAVVTIVTGNSSGQLLVPAQATTFKHYHCADDTQFTVGSYPHDSRAYVHFLDGEGAVTLPKRFSISGTRYSAKRFTLKMSKSGHTTVKRPGRPETACELVSSRGT
jgi:membrane-bound inhibitor of C-type lysozyme